MTTHEKFPFYLRRSFYIHSALFALTLVGGKIILTHEQSTMNKNIELIKASVKVDMVAMPEHTLEELKTMTPEETVAPVASKDPPKEEVKEVVKETAKSEEKIIAKAEDDKRQSFLSKLKQLSGKKIAKGKAQTATTDTHQLKQLVLAGNKLSKGTVAYGEGQGGDLTAFQAYVTKLSPLVKLRWKLPQYLIDKKLKCKVRVWIAVNGSVNRVEIYESSGEPEFDQRALDAVNAASPFPELSADISKRALEGYVGLAFPL